MSRRSREYMRSIIEEPHTASDHVHNARVRAGYSICGLAARMGHHPAAVSRLEVQAPGGRLTSYIDMADALGVGLDELIGRKSPGKEAEDVDHPG